MRLSHGGPLLTLLAGLAASTANAGFLDKLTGQFNKPASGTQIHLAADPTPPAEPSLDAFGGSAPGHVHIEPVQPGAPSIAIGQPAVKTQAGAPAPVVTAIPVQEAPYEGTEYRWKLFKVSCLLLLLACGDGPAEWSYRSPSIRHPVPSCSVLH